MMQQLEDILILENILEEIPEPDEGRHVPGQMAVEAGKYFLEAPYGEHTLEHDGPEVLIANLRSFDCFTFVECCLALAILIPSRRRTWNDFTALLTQIRYRGGDLNGYASRLHYFSDWLRDNVRKGLLRDMTPTFGGIPCTKAIHFMTRNPGLYPPLSDPATARQIEAVEKDLTDQPCHYMPLAAFDRYEPRIKDGDVIGITSAQEGLDVMHAGLAVYQGDNLHLLHASREAGKIIISAETLGDYLRASDARTGIMVGRISG